MNSTVLVGAPDDTAWTYTVTITRDPADSTTDWTTATAVVLLLPDGVTSEAVTKTSATVSTWVGTIKYNAWWTVPGVYPTKAKATFADNSHGEIPGILAFSVGSPP